MITKRTSQERGHTRVPPLRGFGAHSHADMEILSYVLEGAREHRDSLGTGSIMRFDLA